jgi:4-aminobutyrate aminotransferase
MTARQSHNGLKPSQSESDVNHSPRRAAWQDEHLDPAGRALLERDARAFLHQSVSTPCLAALKGAQGSWLEDSAGRRYLDCHGNNVHLLGHGHPAVVAAIKEQLDTLAFAPRRFACEPAVVLAERLAAKFETYTGHPGKVLFAPGGSDAVEIALKLARAATGRFKTLSFWDAFHGAGFGAASVGGEALFRSGPIGPLLPGAEHVAPFGCYRCAYGHADDGAGQPRLDACRLACAGMLRYALERESDVAAVIAEPTRVVPTIPPPGYWRDVRAACDASGALLIFDEIPSGLGRTGRFFAGEHEGVAPDIVVLGKSLGGGMLPLAAVVARADLDVGGAWAFGHYTHEKNPLLARAALATLDVIEREDLPARAAALGAHALARLQDMRARHPLIGDVRGRGLLLGVELVQDRATRAPADDAAEAVLYRALARGLSFKTTMGNVLTLTPPLTIGEDELDQALDIIDLAIGATESDRT